MSIAGITNTGPYVEAERPHPDPLPKGEGIRLSVVGELQRDGDVVGLAQGLDDLLQRVLVLAYDPELVALDAHLQLRRDVLDPLAQVARDVVGDARVELDLDLAATLADALRIAGFEQLRRQLAAGGLLAQNL